MMESSLCFQRHRPRGRARYEPAGAETRQVHGSAKVNEAGRDLTDLNARLVE